MRCRGRIGVGGFRGRAWLVCGVLVWRGRWGGGWGRGSLGYGGGDLRMRCV